MTPEQSQRVKSLFERALDLPAAARDAFLDAAGETPSVVAEVRRLLSGDAAAGSFLKDAAATEFSAVPLSPGELVGGHFRIVSLLGRGGMGIVYRADDLVLSRPVALKFLPGGDAGSPQATERMKREARVAAGLNHPNICVVYEIGDNRPTSPVRFRYSTRGSQALLSPGLLAALLRRRNPWRAVWQSRKPNVSVL